MPILIVVVFIVLVLGFIIYRSFQKNQKRIAEDLLKEVENQHEVLDIEERIVDSTLNLQSRSEKLNSQKEKLEDE